MSKPIEPMLAFQENPDLVLIKYPKLASTKIDGFRCVIVDGLAMSRELRPIANLHIREALRALPQKKSGMGPAVTLGWVHVLWHNGKAKVNFDAVGGTDDTALDLWNRHDTLINQLVSFADQRTGSKGRPRFAISKGLRSRDDVGANATPPI